MDELRLATGGNADALRKFLTRTAMRPSGRALLSKLDEASTIVTFSEKSISPAALAMARAGNAANVTFGVTSGQSVTIDGVTTSSISIAIDSQAVQAAHPDKSGVATVGHEGYHAKDFLAGKSPAQIAEAHLPTSETGPASQEGRAISAEAIDLTEEQAALFLEDLLANKKNENN